MVAVKTHFARDDFERILAQYAVGVYAYSEAIQAGTVQTNYRLDTTQGKFVLRYYETRSQEAVLFESELLAYLAAQSYPCPRQIQNVQGAYVGNYRDQPYVLFEFVVGQHVEHPNAQQQRQLIQKAAELQKLTEGYRSPYLRYRWNYTPVLCRRLAQSAAKRLNTRAAWEKLAWLEDRLARLDLPGSIPKGVCHCDLHFSNVLFQGDRLVAVLDFDDANYTYLPLDLVGLIEYSAWPRRQEALNMAVASEVVWEYGQHRELRDAEKRHLYDVYKLSIMFDSVWYFGRRGGASFRERRKIACLEGIGREGFYEGVLEKPANQRINPTRLSPQ